MSYQNYVQPDLKLRPRTVQGLIGTTRRSEYGETDKELTP